MEGRRSRSPFERGEVQSRPPPLIDFFLDFGSLDYVCWVKRDVLSLSRKGIEEGGIVNTISIEIRREIQGREAGEKVQRRFVRFSPRHPPSSPSPPFPPCLLLLPFFLPSKKLLFLVRLPL